MQKDCTLINPSQHEWQERGVKGEEGSWRRPSLHAPVHRLHLSRDANDGAWQEIVKLLEQFPDVGLVL